MSTNELPLENDTESTSFVNSNPNSIAEDPESPEAENNMIPFKAPNEAPAVNAKKYTWRIDLSKSEVFWPGWFEGLSQKFLDLYAPKLLLLAGIDNLDRTLTVGQMQGKFQMQVLSRCGHAVHEDKPHEVAEVIASYLIRNRFAEPLGDCVRPLPAC